MEATKTISTSEVATRLVKLCREGKNVEAIQELYSDHIVSIEPKGAPTERTEGKDAVLGKTKHFLDMVEEFHGISVSEPIVSENFFACTMDMEVSLKGIGKNSMRELAVYEVKEGKIVSEQFFFQPQPMPAK